MVFIPLHSLLNLIPKVVFLSSNSLFRWEHSPPAGKCLELHFPPPTFTCRLAPRGKLRNLFFSPLLPLIYILSTMFDHSTNNNHTATMPSAAWSLVLRPDLFLPAWVWTYLGCFCMGCVYLLSMFFVVQWKMGLLLSCFAFQWYLLVEGSRSSNPTNIYELMKCLVVRQTIFIPRMSNSIAVLGPVERAVTKTSAAFFHRTLGLSLARGLFFITLFKKFLLEACFLFESDSPTLDLLLEKFGHGIVTLV